MSESDVTMLLGLCLTSAGLYLLHPALPVVFWGLVLLLIGWLRARARRLQ